MKTLEPPKTAESRSRSEFSPEAIRAEFPLLSRTMRGRPLVYLDTAATAQKPRCVIERIEDYYTSENANIHRGVYELSERATIACDDARRTVKTFLNAADEREVVFVRGTTEGINLAASCLARSRLGPGDEVVITWLEHHSNIVPWQMACEERGAKLRVVPINDRGELILEEYDKLLSERTKVVAFSHQSNALGTINPVKEIVARAKSVGALTLVDGAQAVAHMPVDVRDLGCDFYTFSGHKVFGPTAIGALYGRLELLESLPPYQGGGDMIHTVTFDKTTYAPVPAKFEAGTPNIAGIIGLGTALEFVMGLDRPAIARHEASLLEYATDAVAAIPGVRMLSRARERASIVSFELGDIHPHDVGTVLDMEGIAVRAGHHCAQPIMQFFDVPATVRASIALYNTRGDIDRLVEGLHKTKKLFDRES